MQKCFNEWCNTNVSVVFNSIYLKDYEDSILVGNKQNVESVLPEYKYFVSLCMCRTSYFFPFNSNSSQSVQLQTMQCSLKYEVRPVKLDVTPLKLLAMGRSRLRSDRHNFHNIKVYIYTVLGFEGTCPFFQRLT